MPDDMPAESFEALTLRPEQTRSVTKGTRILLRSLGHAVLSEFPLPNGRRADLAALGRDGSIRIVEVKSSLADFRADGKWRHYQPFCDRFYFAVPLALAESLLGGEIFPGEVGLIVADAYGAAVEREAPIQALAPAARRALLVRFGALAATRLHAALHPGEP
ncbi:MmcB family DNA repair protein [Methylocystis bryophila]|nr:MmcB family DNA repair protein [Methylocystis bryophila]BDV38736.1 hypothetical protein DSM21852_19890 [Methylocystis bryophila]